MSPSLYVQTNSVVSPNTKSDGDVVTAFRSEDILSTPGVGLDRGGLILIAILSGGDYDPVSAMSHSFHKQKPDCPAIRLAFVVAAPILHTPYRGMQLAHPCLS